MPRYFYVAKSFKGEEETGVMDAKDIHQLAQILRQKDRVLIKAELEKTKEKRGFQITPYFLKRISLKDKMMFTRNLQVMVGSGLTLPRSIESLAYQSRNKKFRKILLDVREEIVKGKNFSEALSKYPNVFSDLFQNMVKVGEESGTLEDILNILTRHMERDYEIRARVRGAMIYPAVIILAMISIGTLMLVMVVPKLAKTFKDLNIELPLSTKMLISFANFITERWYLLLFIILFFVIFFRFILKTKSGKKIFDGLILHTPIFSSLVKEINSAYTVRSLGSLISCGVPIVRSLEIISGIMGNIYYKKALLSAAEDVREGEKLSKSLKPYQNIYPFLVIEMIEVGEETGATAKILQKLATFFEGEVENATKNLTAIIEPFLMIAIGIAVGFFAVSMLQPIYSIMGTL